jgi:hypothetical protein
VWYRNPTGLGLADGTEHGDHGRFNVDSSSIVDDFTAVLHQVPLGCLARAPALQSCIQLGAARYVLDDHLRLATINRSLRAHRLGRFTHRE